MKYLSVCSGIEAATVAWHGMGWEPVAFSEIEPFPCKVLAHHYPNVPNWGDMTKFKEWPDAEIDLLVGGTPCQSFSVAGLRKGLDDPRGNLMLTYLAIANKYKPKYILWENVPGVLSSNGGRDFGTFLGALGKLGYGYAYRVLDAQYVRTNGYPHAVPQRRRRVFVVGCLGDWGRAAAILFDSESVCGNPPPRREAGKTVARDVGASVTFSCGGIGSYMSGDETSPLLRTGADLGPGCEAIVMSHGQANAEISVGAKPTLNCNHEQPIAFCQNSRNEVRLMNGDGSIVGALSAQPGMKQTSYVAYPINMQAATKNGAKSPNMLGIGNCGDPPSLPRMNVRRLTPLECHRLQGFPDYYLHQVPGASDTQMYKALGNSMAVNVMQLLSERIDTYK